MEQNLIKHIEDTFEISFKKTHKEITFINLNNSEFTEITINDFDTIEINSLKKSDKLHEILHKNGFQLNNESINDDSYDAFYCFDKILQSTLVTDNTIVPEKTNESIDNVQSEESSTIDITIDDLYDLKKQLNFRVVGKKHNFRVVLKDRHGKDDCKINSPSPMVAGRTNNGIRGRRYKSLTELQQSIIGWIRNHFDSENPLEFTLSNTIHYY